MKKIIMFFAFVLAMLSCKQNKAGKDIIDEQKMVDVLVDMQITDAYLNLVYQPDTMKMQAHSRYNYIFKRHQIDSAKFTKSLAYYSLNPEHLDELYTLVDDSISRLDSSFKPKPKKVRKIKKAKQVEHDLSVQ